MSMEKMRSASAASLMVHLFEHAVLGIHGGIAKLLSAHLTKTFVALHGGALAVFG